MAVLNALDATLGARRKLCETKRLIVFDLPIDEITLEPRYAELRRTDNMIRSSDGSRTDPERIASYVIRQEIILHRMECAFAGKP